MNIGIIGFGFVGEAQAYAFSSNCDVKIYDIDSSKRTHSIEDVLKQKFIFVCLPTPMKENGEQDLSFIEGFFESIKAQFNLDNNIFIIKSTVLPGTTCDLENKYNIKVVFSPEFLTEQNSKLDMLTQARIIIGGKNENVNEVKNLFEHRFGQKHYILTDSTSAELIKYMCNNFLSVKVSFVNEYFDLAKKLNCHWDKVIEGFVSDPRIGQSHTKTPGPDGKRGFGGTCFPKDINAIISFSENAGVEMNTLKSAWKTNLKIRPEQDWKKLKGRAVS
jgi:UDPglucose 6-dehydrogenase